MQPQLLIRALCGITSTYPNVISFSEFRLSSGIRSKTVAKKVLLFLNKEGIGSLVSEGIQFSINDRVKLALLAVEMGCDMEQTSAILQWRDFECLTSKILDSLGYSVKSNVRFTNPRLEIDVLGIDSKFAVAVDCKHWKHNNRSAISQCAKKQQYRTQVLLDSTRDKILSAVPVLVTLYHSNIYFVCGIPIVPIYKFKLFVEELPSYISDITVIRQQCTE